MTTMRLDLSGIHGGMSEGWGRLTVHPAIQVKVDKGQIVLAHGYVDGKFMTWPIRKKARGD